MSFPIAGTTHPAGSPAANPAYSGVFIPEIWSPTVLHKFYASTVLAAISNTDYEGEIKSHGDKVVIRQIPTITIRDYEADGPLTYERPSAPTVELLIDQGKYWNTILDDVMAVQSDLELLDQWAGDAAEQMKIAIDTDVLGGIIGQEHASNSGATAGVISGDLDLGITTAPVLIRPRNPGAGEREPTDLIVDLMQVLDEQNVPETGRWVVGPSWFCSSLVKSELRQADLTGDAVSVLRNGRIGMVDRADTYRSNLIPNGAAAGLAAGEFPIYAGHSVGLTFASQITEMETLRAESTFGNIVRGLNVYGYKVTDPKALAMAVVKKAA